jgi:hypothetical protein
LKQILIEKYIEPNEVIKEYDIIINLWLNEYGDKHSILQHPAEVRFFEGKVIQQRWYKKGIMHRGRDLPAIINFRNGIQEIWGWYKNGKIIKRQAYGGLTVYRNN